MVTAGLGIESVSLAGWACTAVVGVWAIGDPAGSMMVAMATCPSAPLVSSCRVAMHATYVEEVCVSTGHGSSAATAWASAGTWLALSTGYVAASTPSLASSAMRTDTNSCPAARCSVVASLASWAASAAGQKQTRGPWRAARAADDLHPTLLLRSSVWVQPGLHRRCPVMAQSNLGSTPRGAPAVYLACLVGSTPWAGLPQRPWGPRQAIALCHLRQRDEF